MKKSRSKKKKVTEGNPERSRRAVSINFKTYKDLPPCAVSLANTLSNKTGRWCCVRPVVLKDRCSSCLLCWKFCPEACISIKNGIPVIDYDYCKGCGICAEVCAKNAIILEEEKK